jgi:hypothetical protein
MAVNFAKLLELELLRKPDLSV